MHTVVLGAGALGVATAHYLSRLGHRVTVIERKPGAALETSVGNGAVIHASEVEPWSQPGMPLKILKWLGREDAPMLLRLKALPHILRLGPAFLANCTEARFVANAAANLRLALYTPAGKVCKGLDSGKIMILAKPISEKKTAGLTVRVNYRIKHTSAPQYWTLR